MAGPNGEPATVPRIVLEFPADRVDVTIRLDGVTPAHVYLGAWFLEAMAREIRAASLSAPVGGLVVPRGPVPLPGRKP